MPARRINDVDRQIGARIRFRRRALGLTQAQLAQAIGVSYQQVQKYESGANRITAGRLCRLTVILHVTAGYFLAKNTALGAEAEPLALDPAAIFQQPEGRSLNEAFLRIRNQATRQSVITFIDALAAGQDA